MVMGEATAGTKEDTKATAAAARFIREALNAGHSGYDLVALATCEN